MVSGKSSLWCFSSLESCSKTFVCVRKAAAKGQNPTICGLKARALRTTLRAGETWYTALYWSGARVPAESSGVICVHTCWPLALWSRLAPRTRDCANTGAQPGGIMQSLCIWLLLWCGNEHRRCAVACAYVTRSPPTGASFPATLRGIQCSIGRNFYTPGAECIYGKGFATKVCVERRRFRHALLA